MLVVLAGAVYLGSLFNAPVPATAAELAAPPELTQPAADLAWPEYGEGAVGAIGYPNVLEKHGDQGSVPIASITKIVTALVVLDEKPLKAGESGPDIRFTDKDVDIYYATLAEDGSSAPVASGLVLTERQTLEAMLIPSANNYSVSLANWAFGSVAAYLDAATNWLNAHELNETSVADTSGISPQSVSSPTDLVALGKLALANPTLASIVAMPSADLPYLGTVVNTNEMLGHGGVAGIKTGTTDEAGACLLFADEVTIGSKAVMIVGVLLGGATHPELNEDIETLLVSVKASFHEVSLVDKGQQFGTYTALWGDSSAIVSATAASALVWADEPITATVAAKPVQTVGADASVGSLTFDVSGAKVEVPLVTSRSIGGPDGFWRLGHPGTLFG